MTRTLTVATLLVLAAALVTSACREGVAPFTPPERETGGTTYPLTFGYGQDADPRWSPSGDTVMYHTTLFGTMPQLGGVLLGVPARGGVAVPILPDVQSAGTRPFATPVYSPSGDHIAYMDLMSVDAVSACFRVDRNIDGSEAVPACREIEPLLDSAVLRVRRIGEQRSILLDPALPVKFSGTDAAQRLGQPGPWHEQFHPFQARYRLEHAMLFRPSWAPDGERIAFSDGLAVRIWRVGDPSSSIVPGTVDGVSAAWSPDGEWIALTTLPRADSVVHECFCPVGKGEERAFRTVYISGPGRLVLVRPDGSERIELGEGEEPAWSPDGAFVFVRRDDRIFRVSRADGLATPVAGTDGGRSPAVSPDGALLAFSRSKPSGLILDYDLWIVSLEP